MSKSHQDQLERLRMELTQELQKKWKERIKSDINSRTPLCNFTLVC